jgi:hypothetical protein
VWIFETCILVVQLNMEQGPRWCSEVDEVEVLV